jgi:hypothetical protein
MNDQLEIKQLLCEIRDLQKAHFERYKEFTEGILASEKANLEKAAALREEERSYYEQVRDEERRYQEQQRLRNERMTWVKTALWIVMIALLLGSMLFGQLFLSFAELFL